MRLALVLALAALTLPIHAQSFVPGYLVVDGDTLRGEVALGTEAEVARGLRFRATAGAPVRDLGPPDAEAVGTDAGRRYRRRLFRLRPPSSVDTGVPNERLAFGRVVRDGPASLLALEVFEGRSQFYLDLGDGAVGLFSVVDQVEDDRVLRQRNRALYRQTLLTLLGRCGVDLAAVEELPYTEAALAGVVDTYNRCADPSYAVQATVVRATRVPVTFGVDLGVGYLTGTFSRRIPRPDPSTERPDADAVHVQAGATVGGLFGTPALHARLGVSYDHHLLRAQFGADRQTLISPLLIDLGGYAEIPAGPLAVRLGGGVLGGTVLQSESAATEAERATANNPVPILATASGGQYVEAGVRLRSLPVAVRVRAQTTAFSQGGFYLPFLRTLSYRVRGVTVSAVATL